MLGGGKNVFCEKAFTVSPKQAIKLAETARQKNLLLTEGL
jgi:predicted dehydrogenase